MGSEQSAHGQNTSGNSGYQSGGGSKLQRGHTIAAPGSSSDHHGNDTSPSFTSSSPPISVCSDYDLPYISYTGKSQVSEIVLQRKKKTKF